MSVLDDIVAGVRIDLARREESTSVADLRAALADVAPPRDPMPHLRAAGSSVIAEVKRKSPSKGDARRHRRPGRPRLRLRARRRRRDQRAHRGAPLRRQPRRPARRPCSGRRAGPAQGLHRQQLPAARGPRGGGRPGPADRGRARRRRAAPAPRRGARARPDRARRGPRRGWRPSARSPSARSCSASTPATSRPWPSTTTLLGGWHRWSRRTGCWSPSPASAGPQDVERFVGEGARAVLVGEALVRDGDPEAAVRAMTGVGA